MTRSEMEIRADLLRVPHRERVQSYAEMLLPPVDWAAACARTQRKHAATLTNTRARAQQERAEAGAGVAMGGEGCGGAMKALCGLLCPSAT